MKVGFDAKRYFHNKTGLGNYSRSWINALSGHSKDIEIQLFASNPVVVKREHSIVKGNGLFYRTFGMGKQAQSEKCDIFHGLSNEIPMDKVAIPQVCTIHDVIFKQFPKHYTWIDRHIYDFKLRYACKNAQALIVTSQTTKNQLLQYYRVDENKIHVIYQSINPRFSQLQWSPNRENPYIFYHSTFNERKNHTNLIYAFSKVQKRLNFRLVLAGSGKKYKFLQSLISDLRLNESIQLVYAPSESELSNWLCGASAFVYPSLQEGFGIPLVEAATLGMPILSSDIEIFRELLGDLAVSYFDPYSIEDMSIKLDYLNTYLSMNIGVEYQKLIQLTSITEMRKQAVSLYKSLI
jgi:glycosyltransferase involved in cell wall biosynthesis